MPDVALVKVRDTITPDIARRLALVKNTRPLMGVLAKTVENDLREWFRLKNLRPNKRGWPKQGFWNRIRNATAVKSFDARTGTVAIADPAIFAHTTPGGFVIKPKEAKQLAIPVDPMAAGVMPRSGLFQGLFKPKGKSWLAIKDNSRASGIRILYALKNQVIIPYDTEALPPQEKLEESVGTQLRRWMDRNAGRAAS